MQHRIQIEPPSQPPSTPQLSYFISLPLASTPPPPSSDSPSSAAPRRWARVSPPSQGRQRDDAGLGDRVLPARPALHLVSRGCYLKSVLCKHDEGLLLVKVYFKRAGEPLDLKDHERRLEQIRRAFQGLEGSHLVNVLMESKGGKKSSSSSSLMYEAPLGYSIEDGSR